MVFLDNIIKRQFTFIGLLLLVVMCNQTFAVAEPVIEINGLDKPLEDNVNAYLALRRESCAAPHWEIEQLVRKSPQQIKQALRALGYYQPEIKQQLTWKDDCWQVVFDIDAGIPVRLNEIDIKINGEGANEEFFSKLLLDNPLQTGSILDHSHYENFKSRLISVAESKGFFDHQFDKHVLAVNPEKYLADIIIYFNTGHRYFIKQIDIEQDFLEPGFVRRYLQILPGQPYDRNTIIRTHQALDGSGYFKQIQVKYLDKEAENFYAPVEVLLEPNRRHVLSFGTGYDTDLGIRGNVAYTNRFLNRSGHRFNADLSISQRLSYIFLDYSIPLLDPLQQKLSFTGGFIYENTESVQSKTFKLGTRFTNQYKQGKAITTQLNFIAENFNTGVVDNTAFKILLVPGLIFSNIKSEKNGLFLDGFKYSLQLDGAHRNVVSDVSFFQAKFYFKYSHSFFWKGRVLARTNLGATAVSNLLQLPTSFRFYAGGENSIRAYKYKSLGPTNNLGEVVGGKYLSIASLEYEQQILDQWSVAAFVDAGNAFTDKLDIKVGVGLGVRWYSLVGPIRADIAFPTEDIADFRFNFSFSTAL